MHMTPAEEAHLRMALAERERALALALTNSNPGGCTDIRKLRAAVQRLRNELDGNYA